MFLRATTRKKDGKEHRYFSVVENRRVSGGRVLQPHVLYLGVSAAVHAAGRVSFLDDPSQVPHCKPKVIYEFFGIAESTAQNKSKEGGGPRGWPLFLGNPLSRPPRTGSQALRASG
ncbi:MAG: hypothetical protein JNL68_17860 [Burkholderiales bacterium]|nr:hypothetical protein [Burkholderiales bacterium]